MHESSIITTSDHDQLAARRELFELMDSYPASDEEKERSLGLFVRGSLLARMLGTLEVYQRIVGLPGAIVDLGTWRGQTAVLCENFRAIYEPLNFQRRIHAFDTFTGYAGFGDGDPRDRGLFSDGTYSLPGDYAKLLAGLLELHERNNAMGHVHGKHRVWEGDVRETLREFAAEHPGESVALAWFDLNAMAPTRESFEFVLDRLVPGGVVAFWQLGRGGQLPTEGMFYVDEVVREYPHTAHITGAYPSLSYLVFPQGARR
ncbi:MAG TPA: class I SAM-dependent methyltransferase [Ilumatobacter sp.]|nr:class I SAM-dependent methyltransferase [Ilumatobacter sp.]